MNKTWIIAKYEYLSSIKRASFWAATLFMPIFVGIVSLISGYTSTRGEELFTKINQEIKTVVIIDETGVIDKQFIKAPLEMSTDSLQGNLAKLKNKEINAIIFYPANLFQNAKIQVFTENQGLLSSTGIEATAVSLLKESGTANITNQQIKLAATGSFGTTTSYYDQNGVLAKKGFQQFIIPGISAIIFFLSVFMSSQFLLQSVSEEKENRMIESLLSIINSKTLLNGKIIGLSAIVITQQVIWVVFSLGILLITKKGLNFTIPGIDWSALPWHTVPINIFFILCGFFLYAAIMVGVGSIGTSYKDSQGLSSIFIIMAIIPVYFITLILAEPNGLLARITSIFPFTAPMILLIRNSLGELNIWELIAGIILVLLYVIFALKISYKLFDLGALMYNRRPNLKELWHVMRR
ncbi:MAG: ABC transporter permease [bacterium]